MSPLLLSKVMTLYYAMPEEVTAECKKFDLKVKLDKQDSGKMFIHNV